MQIEQISLTIIRATEQFTTRQTVIYAPHIVFMILKRAKGLDSFLLYLFEVVHAPDFYCCVVAATDQSVTRLWD